MGEPDSHLLSLMTEGSLSMKFFSRARIGFFIYLFIIRKFFVRTHRLLGEFEVIWIDAMSGGVEVLW